MTDADKQRLDRTLGSLLLLLLRAPVIALGKVLGRDHAPEVRGDLLVLKMQGGGSLVLAYTLLLGLRERYPDRRLLLLTTPAVAPFAETLRVFDEILVVDDAGLPQLLASAVRAWRRCWRVDTVIDLEVYSQLTTAFSVLTAARNRVGFYLESTFWRRGLHTDLVFFNRFSPAHVFYEQLAGKVGAAAASLEACAARLREGLPPAEARPAGRRIAIGHACSGLGRERMLTPSQWLEVFRRRGVAAGEFVLLGSRADRVDAEAILAALGPCFPEARFIDRCGEIDLAESVAQIAASDEFWGIDSSLLHYARLLGVRTVSFWGPTDPRTRLRATDAGEHEVYYHKVHCSPCIHVAETPPCGGRNVCIESLFADAAPGGLVRIRQTVGAANEEEG